MYKSRGIERCALRTAGRGQNRSRDPLWLFIDLHGMICEVQILPRGTTSDSALSDSALADQLFTTSLKPSTTSSAAASGGWSDDRWAAPRRRVSLSSLGEEEESVMDGRYEGEGAYSEAAIETASGGASGLTKNALYEANFLYEGFKDTRDQMNQIYQSAPQVRFSRGTLSR